MGGIFGHVGFVDQRLAKRCLSRISHRGPDYEGIWHRSHITLGHARLSIADLSSRANQPMSYSDERFWIVFDGEIYNFIELRAELEAKGYTFRTDSDTEVVLASFTHWGEHCQDKFNGMWAFAIWDDLTRILFLSRDRFGQKPLFYAWLGNEFAFSSEMKGMIPLLPNVTPNRDLIQNIRQRMFDYESSEECLISGIRRFPKGYCAWLKDGKFRLDCWWSTLDNLVNVPTKYEDQVAHLRHLLLDACRLRMPDDVAFGSSLSGGLDSSAIISGVCHVSTVSGANAGECRYAFTASFPRTPLDEVRYARQVCDHLGISHVVIEIDPLEAIDALEEFIYLFEEMYVACPLPFMVLFREIRKHGIKVTIDGHGADEVFGGYSFDYISSLKDAGLSFRKTRMILDTLYEDNLDPVQFRLPSKLEYWVRWQIGQLTGRAFDRRHLTDEDNPCYAQLDELNKTLYTTTHKTLLPTLLRNYDRYSMAHGVEIRMPFLDHRVVTYGMSLPWTSKIRNGFSKAIIRDAMSPFLPDDITYRKRKVYFSPPIVNWIKGPLKDFFLDLVESPSFKNCGLVDAEEARRKTISCVRNPNATFKEGEEVWVGVYPYLWEKSLIKRALASRTSSDMLG